MPTALWVLWAIFLFVALVAPIGYGWARRGWDRPAIDLRAWRRAGLLVWLGLAVSAVWAVVAFVLLR